VCIEEVAETNILQIAQVTQVQMQGQEQCKDEDLDIFQVFMAEKKKRENKATKVLKLTNPLPAEQVLLSGHGVILIPIQVWWQTITGRCSAQDSND
jgi:hypothetical protein